MSEEEGFLARWSRRKREAEAHAASESAQPERPEDAAPTETSDPLPDVAPPPPGESCALADVDLSALPSIDSITAATDIRAFLAPGVPVELARAALRRVWSADPAIRDFVGIAENQWDFTAPGGAPGFGSLEPTEEIRRLVSRIVGERPDREGGLAVEETSSGADELPTISSGVPAEVSPVRPSSVPLSETDDEAPASPPAQSSAPQPRDVALQEKAEPQYVQKLRKGGALPH